MSEGEEDAERTSAKRYLSNWYFKKLKFTSRMRPAPSRSAPRANLVIRLLNEAHQEVVRYSRRGATCMVFDFYLLLQ